MKAQHIIVATVLLLAAGGCTTYKKYSRPDEISPENIFGEEIAARDTASIAAIPWKDFFTDSHLRNLIETGLANNPDLRIAGLRVKEAEAPLMSARLAYLPTISFEPQGNVSRYGGENAVKTYSLGLSADWEIDLSGRITNEKRGAVATLHQQESYRQAVSTQLVATIANTYFNLLTLDEQLSVSKESLSTWDEIIRTLEVRKKVGEANEAAVAQARASKLEVENTILSLSQQRHVMENSLCTLLGWTPRAISRGTLASQTFPDTLSVGIPLQLLGNRPDIRQAEYELQSAFYTTNAARSAFYPSVTLKGTIGWTNNSGSAIVNPAKWLLNALGSIVQPLFNRGRNIANLKIAKAQQEEALVSFQKKILEAGAEVNNALSQWQNARQRLEVSRQQTEALERAVKSTRLLMTHSDNSSYLEVLTAQQSLLAARLTETQEHFDKIQGIIKLYHALGGGK